MKNIATNLSNLKCREDNLDVDKLVPAPIDLGKLNDLVKNGIVRITEYNELVKKS